MLELLFVSILAGATCQTPPPPTEVQAAQTQAPEPDDIAPDIVVPSQPESDDPVVCEMHAYTGSMLRRRVCRRESEIERQEEDTQFRLRNMRRWGHIRERSPM